MFATTSSLVQSLTDGFNATATECLSALGSIVPVALPVMGGVVVVTLGVKMFRKIAK